MFRQKDDMLLSDVLKCFRAPLSEEQALAVCYQSAKELIAIHKESFGALRRQKIDIELTTIELRKDGSVFFTSINESSSVQAESAVLFDLGRVVYECLDYGMEPLVERQLEEGLESLIFDMTKCEQGDEEISLPDNFDSPGTSRECVPSKGERKITDNDQEIIRVDITLEAVLNRCASHLPTEISNADDHFRAVSRALANEAMDLSTFLQQLCNGQALVAQTWGRGVGPTNWAFLQSLQAAEWAQLWLQVMKELRQGVSLRHVDQTKFPPSTYELSPYEILLKDIQHKRYTLNHVNITAQVKKDAHDVILEFIRSRPPLTKASLRKVKQFPKGSPSPHDTLLSEIRSPPKLKPTPRPVLKSVREIYFEEKTGVAISDPNFTPTKRKCLKPAIKLTELINRWDSSSTVEIDISPSISRSGTPQITSSDEDENNNYSPFSEHEESSENVRKASNSSDSSYFSLGELTCIQNTNFDWFDIMNDVHCDPVFPPSLAESIRSIAITSKIYMTMKEVKHIRRTLAMLELEALDPEERLFKELTNGRLCFCCRARKFSLFGKWSRVCEICECKICCSCMHEMDSSSSHIFQEEIHAGGNRRDSGIDDMSWPFLGFLNLGGESEDNKMHKICLACKRFIVMHC